MRYLTLNEVLVLHRQLLELSGGADGIRNIGGIESAIAQPRMTFGGEELYPTIVEKAVALAVAPSKNAYLVLRVFHLYARRHHRLKAEVKVAFLLRVS